MIAIFILAVLVWADWMTRQGRIEVRKKSNGVDLLIKVLEGKK